MKKAKILIVEDNRGIVESLQEVLGSMDYDVVATAETGRQATEEAEKHNPDLILMDIVLKGDMDGIEAANEIRSRLKIPVIFMTGYVDDKKLNRAKEAEPYGYLIKPVDDESLRSTIEIALYKSGMENKLRVSEEKYRLLVENTPDIMYMVNRHNRVLFVNKLLADIFQKRPEEIVDKSIFDLFAPEIAESYSKNIKEVIETGKTSNLETKLIVGKKEMSVSIQLNPIRNDVNKIIAVMGVRGVKQADEQIKTSLQEKEMQHRAESNLQSIISLLNKQTGNISDPDVSNKFKECVNRITTVALIHSQLYKNADTAHINMKELVKELSQNLVEQYHSEKTKLSYTVDVDDLRLPVNISTSCALILNELIVNVLKYAFVKKETGKMNISVTGLKGKEVDLTVSDDGIGMPKGFDISKSKGIGYQLIKSLSEIQLQGSLKIDSRKKGTTVTVKFEK